MSEPSYEAICHTEDHMARIDERVRPWVADLVIYVMKTMQGETTEVALRSVMHTAFVLAQIQSKKPLSEKTITDLTILFDHGAAAAVGGVQ